jgi:predicted amidohydrolase
MTEHNREVVRIAVVQPMTHAPPDDERNIADAERFIQRAADAGADFVAFPETYPGPWRSPVAFDPTEAMAEDAHRCGVHVVFGTLRPIDERRAHNAAVLVGPSLSEPATYLRTHPPGPWIYEGGDRWDFDYVAADRLRVFSTPLATVGLGICSEVYMPEVTRALALRGAEIIFLPAGTDKLQLWSTWRTLIWARAIENLAVVVTSQNLFAATERGLAMVATPEEVVFEAVGPGMFLVSVDLGRCRALREGRDTASSSRSEGAKAGVLSQWQRPELADELRPVEVGLDRC